MKILITGGAGFIGSHTADALLRSGYQVRVLDNLAPPVHVNRKPPSYLDERIELLIGDVCDKRIMLTALKGCNAVFHLAAFQDYLPMFSRYFDVNVYSTALIYELIVREKLPVRKVILASSQAAVGEGLYRDANNRDFSPDMRPDEQLKTGQWEIKAPPGYQEPLKWLRADETIANPQNAYGISKISAEKISIHLGRRYNIPSVAMRYSIVQGPRQSFYNAYSGACRIFCLAFHQGEDPPIYEDGEQIRDFVNVEDVVDANLLVLDDARSDYQVFNVGGDKPITVSALARVVAEVYEKRNYEPKASGNYRFGDTRHICSDVTKMKNLGWTARRSIYQSIESYRKWLESARLDMNFLAACNERMSALQVVRSTK